MLFGLRFRKRGRRTNPHGVQSNSRSVQIKPRKTQSQQLGTPRKCCLTHAQIEEGRAWIERAKLNSARKDHFAAVLMAARAGREKIVDPKFNEEYPVLLTTASDPIDEQEARRQINDATFAGYLGLPLWQTPLYRQHESPVNSVAWSPDGKTLVSGSADKTVKLWEAATGKLLATLQGHTGECRRRCVESGWKDPGLGFS